MSLDLDILERTVLGNTIVQWATALLAALLAYLVLCLARRFVRQRLERLAPRTKTQWDDIAAQAVARTKGLFLLLVALFIGSHLLQISGRAGAITRSLLVIALLVQGGLWLGTVTTALLGRYREMAKEKDPAAVTTISALGFMSRLVIWSVVLLLALDNLGIHVTALVAGLGVGGIAVALAVQNVLGDLFASLSIVLDKPFVNGDFIIVDDLLGSVEYVGLKTTRLRSLSGEQLVFSNADLLGSRIRNYGRMYERRVVFGIGVTYQTPREKLERIPAIIRAAVETQEQTRFDRSHFQKYGDFALQFETVYYVLTPDYNTYMDRQQAINLAIHAAFEKERIEFAYPTQTVFVANGSAPVG
jgi:small-conductance mechanosensitive channel